MLILGLLGMYFDAAVVFVTSQTLFLRLALAILCQEMSCSGKVSRTFEFLRVFGAAEKIQAKV